ncbi:MAG TPA: preprotein translocase subunit YajC [Blastocatellia bacterium]|nr:preprotein translocase subunit YajC [Blastocatellia bacterium]
MTMTIHLGFLLFLQQPEGGLGSLLISLLPFFLIFLIFFLLVIRPQQKRQRQAQLEREQMLNALKPGDKVVTTGGILGTIVAVRDDKVQLRIAQSVSIEVLKSSIYGLQSEDIKEVKEVEAVK